LRNILEELLMQQSNWERFLYDRAPWIDRHLGEDLLGYTERTNYCHPFSDEELKNLTFWQYMRIISDAWTSR
jgi:hypothetical protein